MAALLLNSSLNSNNMGQTFNFVFVQSVQTFNLVQYILQIFPVPRLALTDLFVDNKALWEKWFLLLITVLVFQKWLLQIRDCDAGVHRSCISIFLSGVHCSCSKNMKECVIVFVGGDASAKRQGRGWPTAHQAFAEEPWLWWWVAFDLCTCWGLSSWQTRSLS